MQGIIGIDQLKIHGFIGVNEEEKIHKQDLFIDIKLETEWDPCIENDELIETINYVDIANLCAQLLENKHYHLLETFASDILKKIVESFSVEKAWIRITKPKAILNAKSAFVEAELRRN